MVTGFVGGSDCNVGWLFQFFSFCWLTKVIDTVLAVENIIGSDRIRLPILKAILPSVTVFILRVPVVWEYSHNIHAKNNAPLHKSAICCANLSDFCGNIHMPSVVVWLPSVFFLSGPNGKMHALYFGGGGGFPRLHFTLDQGGRWA